MATTLLIRHLEDEELALYLSAADALVLPFERILTSSSILLGMSFGLPIIAPKLGPIEEALAGADELLYNPGNADGLAKALIRGEEIDLAELGNRTGALCANHRWEEIGKLTAGLYEKICQGS